MKILYFTDSHIRGNAPKSRLDDYFETCLKKHQEILDLARDHHVDAILHGGDLFDRPDVSIAVVSAFSKLLMDSPCPFYIVSGNHDIYGHNPETINRTMLGLLNNIGLVHLMNDESILLEGDCKVKIHGTPYRYGMDQEENRSRYILKEKGEEDYLVHVIHGFLMDKPIHESIAHTLVTDIQETSADVTLTGHYHTGFKTQEIDGKYFINPGSIVRIANNLSEIKRRPKVILLEFGENIQVQEIYLKSALPGEEVLDRSEIEQHQFKKAKLYEFQELIDASANFAKSDVFELIGEISAMGKVDDAIKKEAIRRLAQVQEEEDL